MAMVVKNNMSAVSTLNTLNKNQSALAKSLQKVSSGMKINSAQDDASGYAISERMRVMIRSLDQANDNTQNGSSLMKVAEGAVANTVEILTTLKQKAINAATDTNTDEDRATIQKEIDQLVDQIDSNALITFNGKYLLDGSKTQRAVYNTNTAMTNEKLDVDTTGTTKLTELRSRKGELLRIQSTDEVHASFVINGKTYTTTYTVSDTTLQDIFANLNKAGKEQGLVDANGNSIDAFGPANTATKTVPAGTAANITIDSETTLIAAANDINSYDGDVAVLKADATAYLTAHSVEDSANNLADALQTFLGSKIALADGANATAVTLKYDDDADGTADATFGAFTTVANAEKTLNKLSNTALAAGIDNMISKLAEVADNVDGETLSSMTNTLTTMITSLTNDTGTMDPMAGSINLDSDTAAAVEQFALSYLSYKIANSGAAPTVSTSTTPLGNQTALNLGLSWTNADPPVFSTVAAAEDEYIDVINEHVVATDELKASVKAYLASGATSDAAKEDLINTLVDIIGKTTFSGAIETTAAAKTVKLTDGTNDLLTDISITEAQSTATNLTLATVYGDDWDTASATLAEKLSDAFDAQIAYGATNDLEAAVTTGGSTNFGGTSQNLTTKVNAAVNAILGTLTISGGTQSANITSPNADLSAGATAVQISNKTAVEKAKTEFAKAYLAEKMDVSDKVEDNGLVAVGTQIGLDAAQNMQYTADGQTGLTVTAANSGVDYQISGLTINIKDSNGQNRTAVNEFLDAFSTTIFATNVSEDTTLKIHTGAFSNQSISVSLEDMRAQALGLKSLKNEVVSVATVDQANAAISVFNNALQKALDIQTTIGAIEARLEYTSTNLTTSSENVQSAESTIRDADMAKEMTNYTKNNVLLQAAQSMLAQANQNSSAVLSLLQ